MLTVTEKYMVEQSLNLYNQILYTRIYSLIWKSQPVLAAWDSRNKILVSLLVGELTEDDFLELQEILYNYENNS